MGLTETERDLILRGLFELTITHVEEDRLREETRALTERVGGNPDATFFGADRYLRHA